MWNNNWNDPYVIAGYGERLPIDLVISPEMKNYILSVQEWAPSPDYYYQRVKRLVNDILYLSMLIESLVKRTDCVNNAC